MNIVSQFENGVAYGLHQATYNPAAEEYTKAQKEEITRAAEDKRRAEEKAEQEKKAKEAAEKERAMKAEEESLKTFSFTRMFYKALVYGFYTFLIIVAATICCFGASYATNLNAHRSWQFQLWCALYGFVFNIPVILYSFYRWFNGRVDPYFGPLPIFKAGESSEIIKQYFGFMVYDETLHKDSIARLKEWESTAQ
jgi:hypothetical protein